ncbi:PQQ-like beta-propeller repeat protein, partial [bacterium]|nr:PQQ-like beta-propeller repeat protein [bacterium]
MKFWKIIIQTGCWVFLMAAVVTAADWPMWRFDAGRTAASPEQLSDSLHLQWSRTFSPRQPVWDDPLNRDLMPYDSQFEPIVMGQSLIIGFNDQDKVMALDVESGREKWTFYTNGPVRLPAAGWQDRIFVTSDDGFLYCLNANDGTLLWKFNGGPDNSLVLGNKRLISTWPARGGAVVAGDTVYFAASIWPFMGVFIYALDPEDGDVIWRNEGSGATYMLQPHRSPAFAGIAPQGAMAVSGSNLLIPGGRSVPACFDRYTGEMRYYRLSDSGKTGGSFICVRDSILVNHYREGVVNLFNLNDGEVMCWRLGKAPVLMSDRYFFAGPTIVERSPKNWPDTLQTFATDADFDLIQAGDKLFAAGDHCVSAVKFAKDEPNEPLWEQHFVSQPKRLLAAQQHLFVVTEAGEIFSYGPAPKKQPIKLPEEGKSQEATISRKYQKKINGILDDLGKKGGYAYVAGCDDAEFLHSLTLNGDFENIVAFVSEISKRDRMQRQLDRNRVYGNGVSILPYSFSEAQLPPYLADILVFPKINEKSLNAELLGKVAACLHPYGGKAWLPIFRNAVPLLQKIIDANDFNLTLTRQNHGLVLTKGALKGAGNWTHQYGNIANTVTSTDTLVKAPLGLLWFGGNSNLDVLPRHGHGPPEQVVNGRLYLEGMNCLSARDVYTGRVLWKRDFENLGNFMTYFNETYTDTPTLVTYNQEHIPGANSRGTNFIVAHDWVYLVEGPELHVLNAESGDEVKVFYLATADENTNSDWQFIGIDGERLIAGTGAVAFSKRLPQTADEREAYDLASAKKKRGMRDFNNYDNTASTDLVVLDRHTGAEKWR